MKYEPMAIRADDKITATVITHIASIMNFRRSLRILAPHHSFQRFRFLGFTRS